MSRFPSLTAAAKEIAYDNGMVNRHHAEKSVLKGMLDAARKRYSLTQLDAAEAEMRAHIAAGKLVDVCCGGSDRETQISPLLDEMLDEMFDPSDPPTIHHAP